MTRLMICSLGLMALSCDGDPSDKGGPADARLTADTWAWPCDFNGEQWVGAKHFYVDLQHAPGLIEKRPVPEPGQCEQWGSTFAKDDLLAGAAATPNPVYNAPGTTVSARRQVDPRSPQGTLVSCASGAGTVGAGCPPPKGGDTLPDSAAPRGARVLLARPADRSKTVRLF